MKMCLKVSPPQKSELSNIWLATRCPPASMEIAQHFIDRATNSPASLLFLVQCNAKSKHWFFLTFMTNVVVNIQVETMEFVDQQHQQEQLRDHKSHLGFHFLILSLTLLISFQSIFFSFSSQNTFHNSSPTFRCATFSLEIDSLIESFSWKNNFPS